MADDLPGPDGHSLVWQVVGLVFVILIIVTFLNGRGLSLDFRGFLDNKTPMMENTEGKIGFLSAFFPRGIIQIGDKVANKGEIIVRSRPGGEILGVQKIREIGTVLEGPIARYNKEWIRVDYTPAPDGWVWEKNLTK